MDDGRLIERVRAGDDAAFEAIVRRHRGVLHGFATKLMSGSRADGDDVVQEALMRALAGLRATDRPIALRPWLFMIVRNRAVDHLRAPVRRHTEGDERLALLPGGDRVSNDPADRAVAGEELAEVVRAIGALPERQRLALVSRELGGASHAQIAAGLGTTVAGAKSLILRARSAVADTIAA